MSALTRSGETACVGPRALPEWRSVRGRRAPCLIAGRKTANLEELQAQRLDPVQQSVKGRLILDRPVKHCLHGLGRHRDMDYGLKEGEPGSPLLEHLVLPAYVAICKRGGRCRHPEGHDDPGLPAHRAPAVCNRHRRLKHVTQVPQSARVDHGWVRAVAYTAGALYHG